MFLAVHASAAPQPWSRFRGPNGSGVSVESDFPVYFGPSSNLLWQTALPPGHSSPCIWEDRLFVTGASDSKLETICLDIGSGKILWRSHVEPEKMEKGSGGSAAPTPATDGMHVFVYSGAFGLVCYDFNGKEIWQRKLPTPVTQHGTGSSPLLANGLLLINRDQDIGSHLLAVHCRDGSTAWQSDRSDFRRGFSTPILWPELKPEVVIVPGTLQLTAYELKNGSVRWFANGLPNEMVSSPVLGDGLVYVAGWTPGPGVSKMPKYGELLSQGDQNMDNVLSREEAPNGPAKKDFIYIDANKDGTISRSEWESMASIFEKSENALLAVRPSGTGDISKDHIIWKQKRGLPYVPSPLYYDGRLYLVKNGGLASCFDAKTGAILYLEERLGALGDYNASPIAANGKILVISQPGTAVVLKAGDKMEVLARNSIGDKVTATPALFGQRLFVRSGTKISAFGTRE